MKITFDPNKRARTLLERGLDFQDASIVISNKVAEYEDKRKDYGEMRMVCFGLLHSRLVVVCYVKRNDTVHVFSMRKANAREQANYIQ